MITRGIAVAILLTACSPLERMPGQDDAERIVWRDTLHQSRPAPLVEWWHDTNCGERTAVTYDGNCRSGLTLTDGYVLVAWRGNFAESAYTHELIHAMLLTEGDEDSAHAGPEWSSEEIANKRLKESVDER